MSIRQIPLRVALMLAALALFLALLEAGVRALQASGVLGVLDAQSISLDDPERSQYNVKLFPSDNPILVLKHDHRDPAINEFGMRDHEYRVENPDRIRRIAVMGDSVTFGLYVPLEASWPKQLEVLLDAGEGGRHQAMNFGVNGYGTEAELELFKLKARQFRPEIVIVGYVMNDPAPPGALVENVSGVMRDTQRFGELAKWSQVLAFVNMNWTRARSALKSVGHHEELYSPEGPRWRKVVESFRGFKELSQEDGFELVVVIFPMLHRFDDYAFAGFHQQVAAALEEIGIPYLDLFPAYSQHREDDLRIKAEDHTHPNELGHRIAAEEVHRFLQSDGERPH